MAVTDRRIGRACDDIGLKREGASAVARAHICTLDLMMIRPTFGGANFMASPVFVERMLAARVQSSPQRAGDGRAGWGTAGTKGRTAPGTLDGRHMAGQNFCVRAGQGGGTEATRGGGRGRRGDLGERSQILAGARRLVWQTGKRRFECD